MTNIEPPLDETLRSLPQTSLDNAPTSAAVAEEIFQLPLVDLGGGGGTEKEMARAAVEWGFFQVVNHGISKELLEKLMTVEKELFQKPFEEKSKQIGYCWGNPGAKSSKQLFWSEAFHISIADVSRINHSNKNLRQTLQEYAKEAGELLQKLAKCLAEALGMDSSFFRQNCPPDSSYLRLNRYPPCPLPAGKVCGLIPHTDSSILTLVYQDQVGGLQLVKDGKWLKVRPSSNALVINVGDLLQAMSNDVFKSVRHRVVVAQGFERFSAAYFYCPAVDALIHSFRQPAVYRPFTSRQYAQQVKEDVKNSGDKVGVSRFLNSEL